MMSTRGRGLLLGVLAVVVAVAGVLIAGPRMAGGRHETVP
jgi:hypothetical protein